VVPASLRARSADDTKEKRCIFRAQWVTISGGLSLATTRRIHHATTTVAGFGFPRRTHRGDACACVRRRQERQEKRRRLGFALQREGSHRLENPPQKSRQMARRERPPRL